MSSKLNPQQEMFCREYLIDLNGTQAAIRAGYSVKTAESQASRLLTNAKVKQEVSRLKKLRNQKLTINAAWVLEQAVESFKFNIQEISDKDGNPQMINAPAAGKFLEMCGKHVDVNAFTRVPEDDEKNKPQELNITFEVRDSVDDVNVTNAKPE